MGRRRCCRTGIILVPPKNTKTYNKKKKPLFNRHLGYLATKFVHRGREGGGGVRIDLRGVLGLRALHATFAASTPGTP